MDRIATRCRLCGVVINIRPSREGRPGAFQARDGSWVRWCHYPGKRRTTACTTPTPKDDVSVVAVRLA